MKNILSNFLYSFSIVLMMLDDPNDYVTRVSVSFSQKELSDIYRSCFGQVCSMVMKNSGGFDDARDIFQESMMAWINNVRSGKYQPSAKICSYLYRVAYNKWMKELKKKGNLPTKLVGEFAPLPDEESTGEIEKSEKQMVLIKCMEKLDGRSQQMLRLCADGVKDKDAAKQVGIASDGYYRIALMRAKEKVIKCMKMNKAL